MPDVDTLPIPFEAYNGNEPYVFVSYAHKDSALVFPEIKRLYEAGYRVWYDEGIDPGNEWPEEVGNALAGCAQFLVFITPRAVASRNVRSEIGFAIDKDKPFLAVHLEETQLPHGMALRMGDIQAILRFRMAEKLYLRKMGQSLPTVVRRTEPMVQSAASPVVVSSQLAPRPESKPLPAPQDLGTTVVRIPAGEFLMGAPDSDPEASDDEKPAHRVVITRPYEIQSTVATLAQYLALMGENPCPYSDPELPVTCDWFSAIRYCNALSRSLGLEEAYVVKGTAAGWKAKSKGLHSTGFRLPTEAEWEYACRAGTTAPRFGELADVAWFLDNSWQHEKGVYVPSLGRVVANMNHDIHPAARKRPNPWGLYDMLGNVREWCWDAYGRYRPDPATDPAGDAKGTAWLSWVESISGDFRVNRGGDYTSVARAVRSSARLGEVGCSNRCGIRPVRSLT
jgi:formylglycine-generating enzyme required for sulfatase activity